MNKIKEQKQYIAPNVLKKRKYADGRKEPTAYCDEK